MFRPGGGIGRRASLRGWWEQSRAGSNPVPGILLILNLLYRPIQIFLAKSKRDDKEIKSQEF